MQHANTSQLIALRDAEPVDAAIIGHVHDCASCTVKLTELRQIQSDLRALPSAPLPPDAWQRIVEQRRLEIGRRPRRVSARYAAALGVVAVGLLVAGLWLPHFPGQDVVESAPASTVELRQRSRDLEYLLQRYETPAVMSLHTAGAISELEDSIALIDYQLNSVTNDSRQQDLWRQRIELMETLITVRAAESYLDRI